MAKCVAKRCFHCKVFNVIFVGGKKVLRTLMRPFVTSCYDWCPGNFLYAARTSAGKIPKKWSVLLRHVTCLKLNRMSHFWNLPKSRMRTISPPLRHSKYLSCSWIQERCTDRFQPRGGSLPSGMHTVHVCTFGKVTEITQDLTGKQSVDGGSSYISTELWLPAFISRF